MGLDTVELVMNIEEAFDVTITDKQASQMETVADIYEFLILSIASTNANSTVCLKSAAFYDLRRHLQTLGIAREKIRPSATLKEVFPILRRRSLWHKLSKSMQVRLPRLVRPSWLALLNCLLVAVITFGSMPLLKPASTNFLQVVLGSVFIAALSSTVLYFLTLPLAVVPCIRCLTMRDLLNELVATNYRKLANRYSAHLPADTWSTLQHIIATTLGIDKSAVIPSARIVQDLGAD